MNYFDGVHTFSDGKARYRQLSKEYHPNGQTGNRQKWEAVHTQWLAVEPLLRHIDAMARAKAANGRSGLENVLSGIAENIPAHIWDRGFDAVGEWLKGRMSREPEVDYTAGDWG